MKQIFKEDILYCFTPGPFKRDRDPIEMVEAQLRGGADVIQLREKEMSKREKIDFGIRVRDLVKRYNRLFIVNDDLDIALILDADGLHLGQEDIPISYARKWFKKIIGISTHSIPQAEEAIRAGADYIGIGPISSTSTKENPDPLVGLDILRELNRLSTIPFVAIGGITEDNLSDIIDTGCRRVAIISDILTASDIELKTKRIKQILKSK
ncbi:MAG TPA: thiamine phosphate synthase [Desulfobacteraceae bacterium]|nr:thiamine phosphate synthase [Desulfobacteraceae bacterium]